VSISDQHSIHRVVITGAPASGKTDLLLRLQSEPFCQNIIFLPEIARALLTENPDFRQNWSAFHHKVYQLQITQENEIKDKSFISDRGTVDAFAFHSDTAALFGTTIEKEYQRYDAVFQLGSAANLSQEYYTQDEIRIESVEDALIIEKAITSVWKNHPVYQLIPASINIEDKYEKLCQYLKNLFS